MRRLLFVIGYQFIGQRDPTVRIAVKRALLHRVEERCPRRQMKRELVEHEPGEQQRLDIGARLFEELAAIVRIVPRVREVAAVQMDLAHAEIPSQRDCVTGGVREVEADRRIAL